MSYHAVRHGEGWIVAGGAKALLVGTGALLTSNRERLVRLAARHAMPTIYAVREFVEVGGLMSYGASIVEAYRQAGIYAGRVAVKRLSTRDRDRLRVALEAVRHLDALTQDLLFQG